MDLSEDKVLKQLVDEANLGDEKTRELFEAFNRQLDSFVDNTDDALQYLTMLSEAIFPGGEASFNQVTWAEKGSGGETKEEDLSAEERLRIAEARFKVLVEQIPAVTFMAVLGEGKNEVYISPHVEAMLGYTQEEWLGNPFLWYNRLHPEDRVRWCLEFALGCQTGGPFKAECRFMARDGHTVWVHGEARIHCDDIGRPQFLQGVAFDITESKRAQEVLLNEAVRTAKIEEEMEIARKIQTSILPQEFPVKGLEIAAAMIPADDVGGDYYDVIPFEGGAWIAVGDVSGHGLDSGLIMLMVQSAMSALVHANPAVTPSEVLRQLNQVIYNNVRDRLESDDHVTLTVIRFTTDGSFSFAGAHEDILHYSEGTVEQIETPGTWIGIVPDIGRMNETSHFSVQTGDLIALFTDGITEARNSDGDMFDIENLIAGLEKYAKLPCDLICQNIIEDVQRWMVDQDDDISLVVMRYIPDWDA